MSKLSRKTIILNQPCQRQTPWTFTKYRKQTLRVAGMRYRQPYAMRCTFILSTHTCLSVHLTMESESLSIWTFYFDIIDLFCSIAILLSSNSSCVYHRTVIRSGLPSQVSWSCSAVYGTWTYIHSLSSMQVQYIGISLIH